MAIICFDIGGSFIKGAVARAPEDISPLAPHPTPLDSFDAFVGTLMGVIATSGIQPERIALSITGVIDPETGLTTVANIPCIHRRPLRADLERLLGLDVLVANDADCFALAEAGLGAGRGHAIVLGAILGSGVGGGLVVNGRLVNESGGFAGEWGHGPVLPSSAGDPSVAIPAYECACGQRRCLNTVGGARGMERLHFEIHRTERTSREIVGAWQAGDQDAALGLPQLQRAVIEGAQDGYAARIAEIRKLLGRGDAVAETVGREALERLAEFVGARDRHAGEDHQERYRDEKSTFK